MLGFTYLLASVAHADMFVWLSPAMPANSVSMAAFRDACSSETRNGVRMYGEPLVCRESGPSIRDLILNEKVYTPYIGGVGNISVATNSSRMLAGSGTTDRLLLFPFRHLNGSVPHAHYVWTGCSSDGRTNTGYTCNSFTNNSAQASVPAGLTNNTYYFWIMANMHKCDTAGYHIYCYEVPPPPSPAPTTPAPTAPTMSPTNYPTLLPTTSSPTTVAPTAVPTTAFPTASPTSAPTTAAPSASPTKSPSTTNPTATPTTATPTRSPTTLSPHTASPTLSPTTMAPTESPTAAPTTTAPTMKPTASSSPTSAAPTTTAPTSRGVVAAVLVWLSPPLSGPVSLPAFTAACSNETVNGVTLQGTPLLCMSDHNVRDVLSGYKVVTPAPMQGNASSFLYSDVALSGETMFTTSFLPLLTPIKLANGSAAAPIAGSFQVWTGCDKQGDASDNCNDFSTPYAYVSAGVVGDILENWIHIHYSVGPTSNGPPSCLGPFKPYRVYCSLDLPALPPTPPPASARTVNEASSYDTNWFFIMAAVASSLTLM